MKKPTKASALYAFNALLGFCTGAVVMIALTSFTESNLEARTQPLFVYGTLTNPVVRALACRCFVAEHELTISNYKKAGRTIVPEAGAGVTGELIYVTRTELRRFDAYENVPKEYRRVQLDTVDFSMWVYIKNDI